MGAHRDIPDQFNRYRTVCWCRSDLCQRSAAGNCVYAVYHQPSLLADVAVVIPEAVAKSHILAAAGDRVRQYRRDFCSEHADELAADVQQMNQIVQVLDVDGNDMVYDRVDPSNIQYWWSNGGLEE